MGAEVRSLYVVLSANATAFKGQMVGAAAAVRQVGTETARISKTNREFTDGLGKAGMVAGGALVAGLAAGVYWNVQLEKQMRNVATISDEVANNMGYYSDEIVKMAAQLPQTTAQLADGFYDIVSSGFDGQEALDVLRISAMSAAAGLTDTAVAAKATLTVLNAYGEGAAHAGEVSDILFQAVNKGIMTYEELAGSIGKVVPTAAAAKVPFDDVAAALAAITLNGLSADEAATSLNQTIAKILIPSDAMADALAQLGYDSGAAALEADGLHKVIERLAKSQGAAADTAFQLFPEIRAARGYMALTSAAGKNYSNTFDAIADKVERAQATQRAYNIQSQSDAATWERISGNFQSDMMSMAEGLMPAFSALSGFIEDLTDMIGALPAPVKSAAGEFGALLGVILLLSGGYLKAYHNIQAFRAGLNELTGTARAASVAVKGLQIGLGIVGIALTAATLLYGAYAAKKQMAKEATDDFVAALQQEKDGVEDAALSSLVKKMVDDGSIDKLRDAGISLGLVINGITGTSKQWAEAQSAVESGMMPLATRMADLDEQLATVKQQYEDGSISAEEYQRRTEELSGQQQVNATALVEQQNAYKDLMGPLQTYRDSMVDAREINASLAEAQQTAHRTTLQHASGLSRLLDYLQPAKDGERQVAESTKLLQAALDGARDPMKALTAATDDGRVSFEKFVAAMEKQVRDMDNYANNLAILASRGRTALVDEFVKMGPEAAGLVAQAVKQSDKELGHLESIMGKGAQLSTAAFEQGLNALPAIAADKGKLTVTQLAAAFTGGDTKAAIAMLNQLRARIQSIPLRHKIDVLIDSHGDPVRTAKNIATEFNKLPKEVRTELATDGFPKAWAQTDALQKKYGLTDEQILTILEARDNASIVIDHVQARLRNLDGDRATTYIDTINRSFTQKRQAIENPSATGSFYQAGHRFADGGFGQGGRYYSRVPQIVRGGANVLWGEQETGWEAYISGKPGMKDRNVSILGEAARRFGYDLTPVGRDMGGGGMTVIHHHHASRMPDRLVLEVDGRRFNAHVRGIAGDEARQTYATAESSRRSSDRKDW